MIHPPNANPVSNLAAHPACTCGKGKIRGFLCWPCFKEADDEPPSSRDTAPPAR